MKHTSPIPAVLIVEDDPTLARLLVQMLASIGCVALRTCATAEDALSYVEENARQGHVPDLVLMDILLPGAMDGIQAAHAIAEKHSCALIFMTGSEDQTLFERAQSIGPRAYLQKPFSASQFRYTVRLALSARETERRLQAAYRELKETHGRLETQAEEAGRLERRLLDKMEQEKQRLGQDLHDDIGQLLTAISLKGQHLKAFLERKSSAGAAMATEIVEVACLASSRLRDAAEMLFPAGIQQEGLGRFLEELAAYAETRLHVACRVNCDDRLAEGLDLFTATMLYRMAQEAVSNAVRHGQASVVDIRLCGNKETFTLTVTDNGRGFSTADRASDGIGLAIMRHRANLLGGTLEVRSQMPGGTVVEFAWRGSLPPGVTADGAASFAPPRSETHGATSENTRCG